MQCLLVWLPSGPAHCSTWLASNGKIHCFSATWLGRCSAHVDRAAEHVQMLVDAVGLISFLIGPTAY